MFFPRQVLAITSCPLDRVRRKPRLLVVCTWKNKLDPNWFSGI